MSQSKQIIVEKRDGEKERENHHHHLVHAFCDIYTKNAISCMMLLAHSLDIAPLVKIAKKKKNYFGLSELKEKKVNLSKR